MPYPEFETQLGELNERGRFRQLRARAGIDFTSNDYLGLAESEELQRAATEAIARGVPVGAGGSRLLRGNHAEHEALEAEAARHFGAETALYFGAGYTANHALFSTLPQRGDIVLYDALVHASVHEGLRHCRAAHESVPHNDASAFDARLTQWRKAGGRGRPWIAVESVYSMDGDSPDLADFMAVADRHDATLVIDEAHATGVLGPDGRGLAARLEGRDNVITLHTCGKALGTSGGFVLAPRIVRDFLVNRARPFIFATAPSPLIAAVTRAALALSREQPDRRERLAQLVVHAARELKAHCGLDASPSHILPIIIGPDDKAVAVAAALQAHGFDVRAIRPPTVPEGTARLRIALTANLSEDVISELFDATAQALRQRS
ncbi:MULTISPECIES: 8-amino-7-oxononanoate synthase [unclassified Bradyrhizobium]|uniref:8-amino-7-oxononanoate synthase n=1 Tax=unclassified Bradyrhizobium TaxID=2631580 RepID=UPI002916A534|nr:MULTISPECIES: 8-amino-7-oxononanoate synthase [unclassified Bradyrhizobium]